MLSNDFFNRDAQVVAQALLGKVIRHYYRGSWLAVKIIETEAYYLVDRGSHSSLGYTEKRKALFMSPSTIYMYYARGSDSLNISCHGRGNAVLIKSAFPHVDDQSPEQNIAIMQQLNPPINMSRTKVRPTQKLCSGQTLLCRSLNLCVPEWDQKQFSKEFYIEDVMYKPANIIQTYRLGIPVGRDEHLLYRFIDENYVRFCTKNPLTKRDFHQNKDYFILGSDHSNVTSL